MERRFVMTMLAKRQRLLDQGFQNWTWKDIREWPRILWFYREWTRFLDKHDK